MRRLYPAEPTRSRAEFARRVAEARSLSPRVTAPPPSPEPPESADPSLLERLHPDGPDIAAQAQFAVTDEWAQSAEDVLRRRTTVALRGLADAQAVDRVERLLDTAHAA